LGFFLVGELGFFKINVKKNLQRTKLRNKAGGDLCLLKFQAVKVKKVEHCKNSRRLRARKKPVTDNLAM